MVRYITCMALRRHRVLRRRGGGSTLGASREKPSMPDAAASLAIKPGLRAIVTAGAGGIGRAIADALIGHGARVHVCDVDPAALEAFQAAHATAGTTRADVAEEGDVARLFADATARLGGLDLLVNNAGIAGPTGAVEAIAVAEWRRCLDIGLTGQFLCTRLAVPLLKAAGGGAIVNMSSAAGRFGYAWRTPYAAAKWGVIGFTQSLAKELGPANIRVNAILPGIVAGPRIERVIAARAQQEGVSYEAMEQTYLDRVSLRRMVTAEDVAGTVLWLVSAAGANISGQSIGVDGNVESL
jgi:NAD(P)-dependent dehydrogenase (short-subunit alcohol dehydrogenase family)